MIALVDEVVFNITSAIKARGWWQDTLVSTVQWGVRAEVRINITLSKSV